MGHGVDPFWTPLVTGRLVHFGHLFGAAVWLGTLGVLALAVFPSLTAADDRPALLAILRDFSVLARLGALVIVVSGVVASWTYLTSLSDLWRSDWGRLLAAKLLTFGGVAAAGFWNWRVITPRLLADVAAARALRRAVLLELILAGALLAITAVLVGSGTPAE
jgi:putative copper export protein